MLVLPTIRIQMHFGCKYRRSTALLKKNKEDAEKTEKNGVNKLRSVTIDAPSSGERSCGR